MDAGLARLLMQGNEQTRHIREADYRALIEALKTEPRQESVDSVASASHPQSVQPRIPKTPLKITQPLLVGARQVPMLAPEQGSQHTLKSLAFQKSHRFFEALFAVDTSWRYDSDSSARLQGLGKGLHLTQRIACRARTRLGERLALQSMRNPCSEH